MNKKVSGHEGREKDIVHEAMKSAKEEFLKSMEQLKGKKEEYKDIKKSNDEERKRIAIEEKKANSFKFSKMEKKMPFFPSLK